MRARTQAWWLAMMLAVDVHYRDDGSACTAAALVEPLPLVLVALSLPNHGTGCAAANFPFIRTGVEQ